MSWIKALDTLFKAKSFHDTMQDVKKVRDYAKKLKKNDTNKNYRKLLRYFEKNDQINAAEEAFRNAEHAADAVLKTKRVWETREGIAPSFAVFYFYALKLAAKHGHDSKQVKAALRNYQKQLESFEKRMRWEVLKIALAQAGMPKMIAKAKAVEKYAEVLQKAFETGAKFPNITSAINYEFLQLSVDSGDLASVAGRVRGKLQKIESRNKKMIKEGNDIIATNKFWIVWVKKDATRSADSLKKNRKAAKPKR